MATIEDVNSRTLLQQFHSLYEKQNETETNVQNLDVKIDQEKTERQTADLSINTEIQTLKDQIDSLGVLFTYKGEVTTIQDLPATNNKPGDVYYVDNEQSEYVWLEKSGVYQWEEFGPAIDLSEYAKQEDLTQLENAVNAMNTKVESNTSNITSLTNIKQDKLTAGTNITIDENNVISASGGSGGGDKLYEHRIESGNSTIGFFVLIIYNNSSVTFTQDTVYDYLYNNGYTDENKSYPLFSHKCKIWSNNILGIYTGAIAARYEGRKKLGYSAALIDLVNNTISYENETTGFAMNDYVTQIM